MDDDLIERAREGDAAAAGELYERHASRVYAVVRRLAGDDATAEDLAQEAWIRVFRGLSSYRGDARFSTWIHRVAANAALNGLRGMRRKRKVVRVVAEVPDRVVAPEKTLTRLRLERSIDELPERMRRVLVLHDVEGYRHEEIATMLGVTVGTSKSQLFRARAKLRAKLTGEAIRIQEEELWST